MHRFLEETVNNDTLSLVKRYVQKTGFEIQMCSCRCELGLGTCMNTVRLPPASTQFYFQTCKHSEKKEFQNERNKKKNKRCPPLYPVVHTAEHHHVFARSMSFLSVLTNHHFPCSCVFTDIASLR
jgi:hypothetical protein